MSTTSVIKRSAFILVFLVFPLFLAFFGNRLLFQEVEGKRKAGAEEALDEVINQIESDKEPMAYFSRFFRQAEKRIFSARDPRKAAGQLMALLHRRFPQAVEMLFLDQAGNPVPELSQRHVAKVLARKFVASYREFQVEKKPLSDTARGFIRAFLSPFIPLDRESHGFLHIRAIEPPAEYVYFSSPSHQGMVVFFFKPARPLPELTLIEHLERQNRRFPGMRFCLASRGETSRMIVERLQVQKHVKRPFWKDLQRTGTGKLWIGDLLLIRRTLFSGLWVVGSRVLPTQSLVSFSRFLSSLPGSFFALAAIFLLIGNLVSVGRWLASVRVKLVLAFLYAVLVPLVIMGTTARTFLEERREVLENETHQRAEKSMQTMDSAFDQFVEALGNSLHHHSLRPEVPANNVLDDLIRNIEKYKKIYGFDQCQIFDRSGRTMFASVAPDFPTILGGQIALLPKIALGTFVSYGLWTTAGQETPPGHQPPPPPRIDPILSSMNFSFSPFLNQEVKGGDTHLLLASLPLSGKTEPMKGMAFIVWNGRHLEWNYLKKTLTAAAANTRECSFFAWSPENRSVCFPQSFRFLPQISPHLGNVVSQSSSWRRVLPSRHGQFLLTAMRGTRLRHFSLLVITPDREIQGEIRDLAWKFRFISLAIIGLCVLVGVLLARLFLGPLGNLTQGLAAISNRDFQYVIPVGSDDELGKLAQLFNDTMDDFKDLEVARTIQECFFPRKPLAVGTWDICGSCLPASQVGGDYFDFFPVDEERALILIGDVSGHGVAAALVVAMAKAVITHPATMGKPHDTLVALNTVLLSILRRKKMMSCCLALLDHQRGFLTIANAGHCYPILFEEGVPGFLELKGYPLGSRKSWQASVQTFDLHKARAVFFYTDGLIEAHDRTGRPIGYEALLAEIPRLIRNSAAETETAIQKWHQERAPARPPEDDISLVILQTRSGEGADHAV